MACPKVTCQWSVTLAVPVISKSGEVIGGLFFGHKDAGVFTEEHEEMVVGVASQAAIAMDNALFFDQLKKANEQNEIAD